MDYGCALCQRITGLELKTLTCFLSGDNRVGDGAGCVVLCCVFGDKDPNGAQIKADKETGQTRKIHMGKRICICT